MDLLGIDLGGTNIRAGIISDYKLKQVVTSSLKTAGSETEILKQIYTILDGLLNSKISGIGIGVPSVVDSKRGIVYDVQNIPSWQEVHLKEKLENRYNIPVYVNNDANCFVAGEKYFGKARQYENVVGLIMGTGLGAGLVANGKLYSGPNCGAGELGMCDYREKNYEYYCSGQFFTREYGMTGEELFLQASSGEKEAMMIFSEFGVHVGNAIKTILYMFDPEMIVLGGSVSRSYLYYRDKVWEILRSFAYPRSIANLKIEVSQIEQVAILGAAALFLDAIDD